MRGDKSKSLSTGLGNDFLFRDTKTQATKENVDKLDFLKIKNMCAPKDTINSEMVTYVIGEV